jgi:hypothetical protein
MRFIVDNFKRIRIPKNATLSELIRLDERAKEGELLAREEMQRLKDQPTQTKRYQACSQEVAQYQLIQLEIMHRKLVRD